MRPFLVAFLIAAIASGTSDGCRSSPDEDRQFNVQHGTEPPEPAHRRPANPTPRRDDAGDMPREAGEVKVGENRWEFPVAITNKGMLWGTIEESRSGQRILAFRGIKYAQPPVGPLRFKPPRPLPQWSGIADAKNNGHVCPQHMYYKPDTWIGNEDCLTLNVFTRDLVTSKARPVIVFIHGGNFVRGSAADYEPDYILDEDVILVTIQYRLGMFGFMSTEDDEAPGNYGMLDQVAALKWVRENIKAFSGDPGRVTIMGQQAGGASVHYHMLSPLSRGLFARAISMSGTALCWWASLKRPLEKTKKLARLLDCPYQVLHDGRPFKTPDKGEITTKKIVDCIRSKSMEQMMNTHPNFYEWKHLEQAQEPMTGWSPRVDGQFVPMEPVDAMKGGTYQHIPWIVGLTDDEGAYKASALFSDDKSVEEFNSDYEKLGPLAFGFHDGQTEAPKIQAASVRDHYWGASLSKANAKGFIDAISDSSYSHPIDTSSKIHTMTSKSPVFVYHFGYRGANSLTQLGANEYPPKKRASKAGDLMYGVGNGDDLIYLFPILNGVFRPLNQEDLTFSQRFIQLLTSFAADGQPKITLPAPEPIADPEADSGAGAGEDTTTAPETMEFKWNPASASNATHLNIMNVWEMDLGLPNHERMSFWQNMPAYWNSDRENYKPAPPPVFKDEL